MNTSRYGIFQSISQREDRTLSENVFRDQTGDILIIDAEIKKNDRNLNLSNMYEDDDFARECLKSFDENVSAIEEENAIRNVLEL